MRAEPMWREHPLLQVYPLPIFTDINRDLHEIIPVKGNFHLCSFFTLLIPSIPATAASLAVSVSQVLPYQSRSSSLFLEHP